MCTRTDINVQNADVHGAQANRTTFNYDEIVCSSAKQSIIELEVRAPTKTSSSLMRDNKCQLGHKAFDNKDLMHWKQSHGRLLCARCKSSEDGRTLKRKYESQNLTLRCDMCR